MPIEPLQYLSIIGYDIVSHLSQYILQHRHPARDNSVLTVTLLATRARWRLDRDLRVGGVGVVASFT